MKKILLIIAVVSLVSCKTENIYLTVFPVKIVTEVVDTIRIYQVPDNRFTMEFQKADSIFNVASDKAMKSAILKTKHLRP